MSHADEFLAALAGQWTDIQDQLALLYTAAVRYPYPRIAEFGVRRGESTRAFLAAAEFAGGHVFSWDVNEPEVPGWWRGAPHWIFTRESSLDAVPPKNLDVLFIDTSHEYDATLAELRRLAPYVRPGGTILMHDTLIADPPGTTGPMVASAVARALDVYCGETGWTWTERGGHFGLGQIIRPLS